MQEEVAGIHAKVQEILNREFEAAKSYVPQKKDWLASHWEGFMSPAQKSRIRNTGGFGSSGGGCGVGWGWAVFYLTWCMAHGARACPIGRACEAPVCSQPGCTM